MKLLKIKLSLFKNYKVNDDGKAPSGLSTGDTVVTGGGTYTITGVNSDGSYKSELSDSKTTTDNYTGGYDTVGSSGGGYTDYSGSGGNYSLYNTGNSTGMDSNGNITDYSTYLQYLMDNGSTDYNTISKAYQDRLAKAGSMGLNDTNSQNFNKTVSNYLQDIQNQNNLSLLNQINAMYQQPEYEGSQWDSVANKLAEAALNMNYEDWLNSDQYKALLNRYGLQAGQSMQNVLGQVASRTGGLASSYATTAAQQQYNNYMAQLEEAAYDMYSNEQNTALTKANSAFDYSDNDYQKYLNDLSQYNTNRSFAYQALADALSQSNYANEWNYTTQQSAQSDARERIDNYLANGGSLDGLDSSLIEDSGYTQAELNAAYTSAQNQIAAANAKSSGSDSGKSTDTTSKNYSTVLKMAQAKGSPTAAWNYLSNQYENGYISYEDAMQIYQMELGYTLDELPTEAGGKVASDATSSEKGNFTGLSEGEFNRSSAMQQQYGNYDEYLRWWYANH